MATKTKRAKATVPTVPTVFHMQDGGTHRVVLEGLTVAFLQNAENGYWCAQGKEIDYTACAPTLQEVRDIFARGLARTFAVNAVEDGDLTFIMQGTPQKVWERYEAKDVIKTRLNIKVIEAKLQEQDDDPADGDDVGFRAPPLLTADYADANAAA